MAKKQNKKRLSATRTKKSKSKRSLLKLRKLRGRRTGPRKLQKTGKKILKPAKRSKIKTIIKKKASKHPKSPKIRPKKRTIAKAKKKEIRKPKPFRIPKPLIDSTIHKTKIRVVGIGGGGGTIVSEITSRIKKADFYVANTDVQALRESDKTVKRFQFGQNLTHGLGTGMNVDLGEMAAEEEKERIEKLLKDQDLCILIACLGGGTSSGATPVFTKISKNLGNLTYGIFTLPFEFEGEKKMEAALESLEKIKPNLNVYTIIPNERIFQVVDKNTPLKEALSAINKKLAENLEGLIETIYLPGLINIDFADLKTVLSGRGRLTYLNSMETEESNKEEVVKKLISDPLYPYTIKGTKGILYNITSGKDIQLSEVSQMSNIISQSVNKGAKIIFGINQNQKYQKRIKITLLATGCSGKEFLPKSSRNKKSSGLDTKKHKPSRSKGVCKSSVSSSKILTDADSKTNKKKSHKKKTILHPKQSPSENLKTSKSKLLKKSKEEKNIKDEPKKPTRNAFSIADAGGEPKQVSQEIPSSRAETAGIFSRIPSSSQGLQDHRFNSKLRKNALQIRKETEEEEKELLEQEKIWETPAILRKKGDK